MTNVSRRRFFKVTVIAGTAVVPAMLRESPAQAHDAGTPPRSTQVADAVVPLSAHAAQKTYLFFNSEEAAFIEAAVARLIPADEQWGGALEAGVPNYMDEQLGGAWGAGERLYRSGPWRAGTPSQGYQLPFAPAELFRTALAAINKQLPRPFAKMSAGEQDAFLRKLQTGGADLGGVPSEEFFAHLWQCTLEGFFSDPVYGGNRDMLGWRMIGFPGAYASYYDLVDKHGIKIDRKPTSLGEDAHGHVHPNPNIPARSP